MTQDQQRIAIAQACGWTEIDELLANTSMGKPPGKLCSFEYLPDYLNDLNAMHEVEKIMNSEQVTSYVYRIEMMDKRWSNFAFATAAHRAEAFLRTLNLWTSTPTTLS
jgi:hypothetical protein